MAGLTRHEMDSVSLNEVIDDARSMSLFAGNRVIWAASAGSGLASREERRRRGGRGNVGGSKVQRRVSAGRLLQGSYSGSRDRLR